MPTIKSCDTNPNRLLVDFYFPAIAIAIVIVIARTGFTIQKRRYFLCRLLREHPIGLSYILNIRDNMIK